MENEIQFQSDANRLIVANPELKSLKGQDEVFERLKGQLDSFELDGTRYYVAESDLLLDEDELFFYAKRRKTTLQQYQDDRLRGGNTTGESAAGSSSPELVGIVRNGRVVRWEPGTVLTYCVLKSTFTEQENYEFMVGAVREACEAWEAICGVSFAHVSSLDESPSTRPDGVLFPVREISVDSSMLASAFFPIDPPGRRRVLINRSTFYNTNFNKTGVLRHELGHVLGFRHEHIRSGAPAACPNEDEFDTIPLTDYDPNSVMHYFCGRSGSKELEITTVDIEGAIQVYGPPLDNMELINPSSELLRRVALAEDADTISFSTKIKPLFRQRDRDAMILFKNFDLWKYDDVVQWSSKILKEVSTGSMPCDRPWEQEKIQLFSDWVDKGMKP